MCMCPDPVVFKSLIRDVKIAIQFMKLPTLSLFLSILQTYIPQLAVGDSQAAVEESAGAAETPVHEEIREAAPGQASITDI